MYGFDIVEIKSSRLGIFLFLFHFSILVYIQVILVSGVQLYILQSDPLNISRSHLAPYITTTILLTIVFIALCMFDIVEIK